MNNSFYANGKLLLTAEYFVLDGALALAAPVKFGQSLSAVTNASSENIHWKSMDEKGASWFEAVFRPGDFLSIKSSDKSLSDRLTSLLQAIRKINPGFQPESCLIQTRLTFPKDWGLGSSSTLIHLLAKWARVNPYRLLAATFGGSGYDLACANAQGPLLYRLEDGMPVVQPADFNPKFSRHLAFVYLGKKQNSREGIKAYRLKDQAPREKIDRIGQVNELTKAFLQADSLVALEGVIRRHENMVSEFIGLKRARSLYFNDYWGEVKSLGAWGGDFVLVTSERSMKETRAYFLKKGFEVFLEYDQMILHTH